MSSLSVSRRAALKNLIGITGAATFLSGSSLLLTACQGILSQPPATPTPRVPSDPPLVTYKGQAADVVSDLYWFPDSLRIASTDGSTIQIWEALTGKRLTTLPPGISYPPVSMGWSPNGKWRIFEFQVVDAQTTQPFLTLTPDKHAAGIWDWSPDSRHLAYSVSSVSDPTKNLHLVQIREVRTGALIQTVDFAPGSINALIWSPDGQNLAIGGSILHGNGNETGALQVWHISGHTQQLLFSSPSFVIEQDWLSWSPDGKFLAFTGYDAKVQERSGLIDVTNGKVATLFSLGVSQCLWSPTDNTRVALVYSDSSTASRRVEIWNPLTNRLLSVYTNPPSAQLIDSIAWSPNGRYIASSTTQFFPPDKTKPFVMVWEPR